MKIFEVASRIFEKGFVFEELNPIKKQEYIARNMTAKIVSAVKADRSAKLNLNPNETYSDEIALTTVKALTQADPSPGFDYLNFIARMYAAGQFKMEDLGKIKQELTTFTKVKNKLQNKDINSYKSLDELYDALEQFQNSEQPVEPESGKAAVKKIKNEQAKKIIDTPNFKVIVPKTHEAACFYGANTKWCTASRDDTATFEEYNSQGPLYVVIAKDAAGKDVKYQFHVETNQYMNVRDQPLTKKDISFLSKFPEYKSFLDALIKKHYFGE